MARWMAAFLVLPAACAAPEAPPESDWSATVEALMERLGSDDIDEREAAEAEIYALGSLAEEALRRHAAGPDADLARRCQDLVARLPDSDFDWYVKRGLKGIDLQHLVLSGGDRHGVTLGDVRRTMDAFRKQGLLVRPRELLTCDHPAHASRAPFRLTCDATLLKDILPHLTYECRIDFEEFVRDLARRANADVELLPGGEIHFLSRREAFDRWWSDVACRGWRRESRPHRHAR